MINTSTENKNEIVVSNNSIFDKLVEVTNHLKKIERDMIINIREQKIVFSELFAQVQDNADLLSFCRSESQITIVQPRYTLLNCISTKDYSKSTCAMFRSNNIVYLTIIFKGIIEGALPPRIAEIAIDMPMWKICSGTFKIESLEHCLSIEKEKKDKKGDNERTNRLCAKLKQEGNKIILKINKNESNIQTYWDQSNQAQFTIKGSFFIEPTPVRATGIFYLFNISSTNVVCAINKDNSDSVLELTNDWEAGCLFEIYKENSEMKIRANNLYLNNANGCIKLEKNKKNETEINYMPGFSDIVYVVLYQDKRPAYLSWQENENNDEKKLILEEEPTTRSQFMIIPKLNKTF